MRNISYNNTMQTRKKNCRCIFAAVLLHNLFDDIAGQIHQQVLDLTVGAHLVVLCCKQILQCLHHVDYLLMLILMEERGAGISS